MAEIEYTLTEKETLYLLKYMGRMQNAINGLYLELDLGKSLDKFPNYAKLAKASNVLMGYLNEFDRRCTDIYGMVKDKGWIDRVYKFVQSEMLGVAEDVDLYASDPFRKYNIKDNITERLKDCEYLRKDITKSLYILADLKKKNPAAVKNEFEKVGRPVKRSRRPEEQQPAETVGKVLAIVLVLGLSFAMLNGLKNMQTASSAGALPSPGTGFYLLPGGPFISSLQMVLFMLASAVVVMYLAGKSLGGW